MRTIFLSYSRHNAVALQLLVGDIEALGYHTWFDQELSGGQRWWDQILEQIRACDVFVLAIAEESLDSVACRRELEYAAQLGKPILPVIVGKVSMNLLPPRLSQLQVVDVTIGTRESALKLARALGAQPEAPAPPNPLPAAPELPVSYLGSLQEQVDAANALDFEEQSAVLMRLKGALRDAGTNADALVLIRRLRVRRDLLAAVAQEIDELLRNVPAVAATKTAMRVESELATIGPAKVGLVGCAGVTLVAAVMAGGAPHAPPWVPLVPGVTAAISGAMIGWNPRWLLAACVAGAGGLWWIGSISGSDWVGASLVFGAPPGMFLIAIAFAIYQRTVSSRRRVPSV